ncbi:MAG TPA: hypothetical protein VMU38_10420 [Candidatus Binatia bacterium]|nr:hypothetical protein [Candidatus Binatia bacterium]
MIWSLAGLTLSLGVAALAWLRGRSPGGFYDRENYGLDGPAHRRYAAISLLFAAFFAIASALRFEGAGIAGLALYAVIAVFYGASFLRGATDRDE